MAAQRDFYADLELPRDADVNEVKKQFRKLALKYHPDRNPGREQEVNAKFQIIQAANEVLSDPVEKSKYDATLGRSSNRYPGASGVRGNPWAQAGAQFPTPPRRSTTTRNAQSGAQRWQTRFSTGVPPTAKQAYGSDPEAKKNAAKAFENMRKNTQREPRSAEPPPPPPRQPPRTESARQRAEASFGSKRAGYHPRSTMPGDEPAVSSQNYASTDRRNVPPPPPPQRPGSNPMPDPLSQFRNGGSSADSYHDDKRRENIPRKPSQDDWTANSPPLNEFQQPHGAGNAAETYAQTSSRTRADAKSTAERSGDAPSVSSAGHEQQQQNADKRATDEKDKPSMYGQDQPHQKSFFQRAMPPPSMISHPQPDSEPCSPGTGLESSSPTSEHEEASPSGLERGGITLASFEAQQTNILNELINGTLRFQQQKEAGSSAQKSPSSRQGAQPAADQDAKNRFSFPVDDDTFVAAGSTRAVHGFAKSSPDDINTSFVNDEGSHSWQFNANNGDNVDSNVGYRHSPGGHQKHHRPYTPSVARKYDDDTDTGFNAKQAEGVIGFDPNGWSNKFSAQTFVPQPTPGPSASPTRAASRANSKKTKTKPMMGTAAAVEDSSSEDETYDWGGRKTAQTQRRPVGTDSPLAMDIDSPGSVSSVGPSSHAQAARNIPVEPSREDWRAGNVNGAPPPPPPRPDEVPRRPAKIPLNANNAVGSEDSEEFRANFADLKNVAPLAHEKDGLESLGGLRDNLPFESKASDDVHPTKPAGSRTLNFPHAPAAPVLPAMVAAEGVKLNTASWAKYFDDFEDYMRKWDSFNDQVVKHFAARSSDIAETRKYNGYGFLRARGDGDVQEYYTWVQQDNDVRRQWMDSCEDHQNRMRELMALRDKMKTGST